MHKLIPILTISLLVASCSNPAEEAVKAELIDPQSAEFRDMKRCSGDQTVWTGEVNAKNRMGAFTGFEPFFYDGIKVAFASDPTDFSEQMERCYSHLSSATDDEAEQESDQYGGISYNGKWIVSNDINPLDDSKTTIASLAADEGTSRFDGPVNFIARCQSNKTQVYVVWHDYLGDDSRSVYEDWKHVEVRVGDEKSQRQRWSVSTDSQATFAPNAISLLRKMAKEKRMVMQTTPYNEPPTTAVFDLTGAEKAINQVAATCNWEL